MNTPSSGISTSSVRPGQVLLDVDHAGRVVAEHPEQPVHPHVDRRRLDQVVGSNGSMTIRPASIASRRLRSDRITGRTLARRSDRRPTAAEAANLWPARGCSSMAEHQLPKLNTGVRFPSSAPVERPARWHFLEIHRMWITSAEGRACHIRATASRLALAIVARRPWGTCASCRPGAGRRATRSRASGGPRRRRSAPRASPTASSPPPAPTSSAATGSTRTPARSLLADYADAWLADRPELRPRTKELYRSLLRLHILPTLGRRAGDAHAGHGPLVAGRTHRGGPSGRVDDRQVLPAAPRHLRHGARGRPDRPQPVRDQGRLRRAPGRAAGRHDRAGLRDRRRHRASLPGDGAAGDVLRPARRRAPRAAPAQPRPAPPHGHGRRAVPAARRRHARARPAEDRRRRAHRRRSRPSSSPTSRPTSRRGRRRVRDELVFPGETGRPFRTATLHAAWHRALRESGSTACASTTSATPATPSPPPPARARRS